jgi:hypothetical protein
MMDHSRDCVAMKGMPDPRGWGWKGRGKLINSYGMVFEITRVCQKRTMRWIIFCGIFLDHLAQENQTYKHWIMIVNLFWIRIYILELITPENKMIVIW